MIQTFMLNMSIRTEMMPRVNILQFFPFKGRGLLTKSLRNGLQQFSEKSHLTCCPFFVNKIFEILKRETKDAKKLSCIRP